MPSQSRRLYFDNAATSFPKPPAVHEAMLDFGTRLGTSPGRGAYAETREAAALLQQCRQRICRLINATQPNNLIFTLNATDALNLAIKGLIHHAATPAHIITTDMDHNSVLRPFNAIVAQLPSEVEQTRIACDPQTGRVDPDDIRRALRPETRLVAVVHGSNVTGTIQPIKAIGLICREAGIPLLVDAAQTAGHIPIDVVSMNIDLLAFPGHKGLLGPLGTGCLYIRPGLESEMRPLREGGTGSRSESDRQPVEMPDRFEPGSHNTIGIIGLSEGVAWLLDRGVDSIRAHEVALMTAFLEALADSTTPTGLAPGLRLLGPSTLDLRVGVFSVTIDDMPPAVISQRLEDEYGILTRAGLHCAPGAHETMSTSPDHAGSDAAGATRLSFGPFLEETDVREAALALRRLARDPRRTTRSPLAAATRA